MLSSWFDRITYEVSLLVLTAVVEEKNMIKFHQSIQKSILIALMTSSLATVACTTGKKPLPRNDVVTASGSQVDAASNEEIPAELRDAHAFDPATTLDQATIKESDFYQIKKSIEENQPALDAAWKEQERLESSLKAANAEVEKKKALSAKAEEEERERQRQIAITDFEKNKEKRAKEEQQADEEIKKLPTISKDEVMWQGLED